MTSILPTTAPVPLPASPLGQAAPLVEIHNLVCQAQAKAGMLTLLDVPHLRVQAGERIAVVGHNGAGKSTLLRALSGFAAVSRGDVRVLGRQLGRANAAQPDGGSGSAGQALTRSSLRQMRAEIGQVMQGLHLVQRVSAIDNVLMGLLGQRRGLAHVVRTWSRVHAPVDVVRAEAALSEVGLLAKADTRVDKLSGGERQKVVIARMLMQSPKLILADEPTASLDPLAASEICSVLVRAAKGATLITVCHNPSLLPLLADRVLGLQGGKLLFDLPIADLSDARLAQLYRVPLADGASRSHVPWAVSVDDDVVAKTHAP